ncbi:MAG: alanine racemase [Fusobacteriaceae bacterium]
MKRGWLEINLNKLKDNYNITKEKAAGKEVMAVVKADAYGLGACKISETLSDLGVNIFGVACLEEALELRKNGLKKEILILGVINFLDYKLAFDNNIQLTISSFEELEYLKKNNFKNPKIHIKIDTGMGRIGFLNDKIYSWIKENKNNKNNKFEIIGIFSHFSSSDIPCEDSYTMSQISKFKKYEEIEGIKYIHIQNSAGIMRFNSYCNGNLVRAGIVLYGYTDLDTKISPIVKFKTIINHLKVVEEDSYISYEKTKLVKKGTVIGTIPIGYADGYDRRFSNRGYVFIRGVKCAIVGRVCMDATMIKIPKSLYKNISIGEEVDILGDNPLEQLKHVGISPYEFLLFVSKRVKRNYIEII